MKALKIIGIIIAVLAILAIIAYFWGKSVWEKITFGNPRVLGLDFNDLTLQDIANIALTGQPREINALVTMDINNQNNFPIPFSSLKVQLFYNGDLIAETSDAFTQNQSLPANGTLYATDNVKILLSGTSAQMAQDKIKNGKITLQGRTIVKIFGIPLPKSFQTYTLQI